MRSRHSYGPRTLLVRLQFQISAPCIFLGAGGQQAPFRESSGGSERITGPKQIPPDPTLREDEPEASDTLGRLHETLGHLNQLKQQERRKPHLAHPTLAGDLHRVCGGRRRLGAKSVRACWSASYSGVSDMGAALDQLTDHRPELSGPGFGAVCAVRCVEPSRTFGAPFAHTALSAAGGEGANRRTCVFWTWSTRADPARARLGEEIEHFLAEARGRFSDLPVLAVDSG